MPCEQVDFPDPIQRYFMQKSSVSLYNKRFIIIKRPPGGLWGGGHTIPEGLLALIQGHGSLERGLSPCQGFMKKEGR